MNKLVYLMILVSFNSFGQSTVSQIDSDNYPGRMKEIHLSGVSEDEIYKDPLIIISKNANNEPTVGLAKIPIKDNLTEYNRQG